MNSTNSIYSAASLIKQLAEPQFVILVGIQASGKSTFAKALVDVGYERFNGDDIRFELFPETPWSRSQMQPVFQLLFRRAAEALRAGKKIVIDLTNLSRRGRKNSVHLAAEFNLRAAIIVFDVPLEVCLQRNRQRDHQTPEADMYMKAQAIIEGFPADDEGDVTTIRPSDSIGEYCILQADEKPLVLHSKIHFACRSRKPGNNVEFKSLDSKQLKHDIIGDQHGRYKEVLTLIDLLGYRLVLDNSGKLPRVVSIECPDGRILAFAGDMVDRGPDSDLVLNLIMQLVALGAAVCIVGNHDEKYGRYLKGNKVTTDMMAETIKQVDVHGEDFRNHVFRFIGSLPHKYETENLIIVHAAFRQDVSGGRAVSLALYGETTGKFDASGFPERLDTWETDYGGDKDVVHGHVPVQEVTVRELPSGARIINVDTGCAFGGKLTALRHPEMTYVQVPTIGAFVEHHAISTRG